MRTDGLFSKIKNVKEVGAEDSKSVTAEGDERTEEFIFRSCKHKEFPAFEDLADTNICARTRSCTANERQKIVRVKSKQYGSEGQGIK